MTEYLRNVWYAAAWTEEITEALFSIVVLDTRVLLYRTADGQVAAMEDRCPHRFAPLSRGRRDGDAVICGYHGLKFAASGRCIHNPFDDAIPAGVQVRTFPVVEKHALVWLWFGDKAAADPASIPDFSYVEAPMTRHGRTRMEANYQLVADNLMDLSHIEFLHIGTFGGQGVIFQGKHKASKDGDTVHSNWTMPNIDPPAWAKPMFAPDTKINHWFDMRWNAPASMSLAVGTDPLDTPRGVGRRQAHILTPATSTSTHYLYSFVSLGAEHDKGVMAAFEDEDRPMLEAVQDNMGDTDFWENKPLLLSVDSGAVLARRVLRQLMNRERQSEAA